MAMWPTWHIVRVTYFVSFQSLGISSFFLLTFNTQFCQSAKLLLFRPSIAPSLLNSTDTFTSLTWSLMNIWLLISSSFKASLACGEPTSLCPPFTFVSHFPIPPAFSWSWKVVVPQDLSWILLSLPALDFDLMLPTAFNTIYVFNPTVDLQPIPITEFQNHTFKSLSSISFWMFHA